MLAVARAKINLFLGVGERRADGYHDLDTIMTAIDRADILDISLAPRPKLAVQPEDLPPGQTLPEGSDNLVWRAAELLGGKDRGWRITLYKTIPMGAGLGGGSSDAAVVLQVLAGLWKLENADLEALAAQLGSDVPFFLRSGAVRATGRGDLLEPMGPLPTMHAVVAVPDVQVSTAEAYSWLDAAGDRPRRSSDPFQAALRSGDPATIAAAVWNDFEPVVTARVPAIGALREKLLEKGAMGAALTGSGSGVYGFFPTPDEATSVAFSLKREGIWAVYAATAASPTDFGRDPMASGSGLVG